MSNKKIKKPVSINIYWDSKNKKTGYEGYKISELKTLWKTQAKTARVYGDTRLANKLDKWVNVVNEHSKQGRGDKIRRMVNITSNMSQNAKFLYGKSDKGMYLTLQSQKPPRESAKMKSFREQRKSTLKDLKNVSTLDPTIQNWLVNNVNSNVKELQGIVEVAVVVKMIKTLGGFNNANSKYQHDIERLLKGGEISPVEMSLLSEWMGLEPKASNLPNKLKRK